MAVPAPLLEGSIASAPDADGRVMVVIPAFHPQLQHGPCLVMPKGESVPERGQKCLVAMDEQGKPWVVAWEGAWGVTHPTIPTTLPPSGAAGGDLTGSYPDPTIAPGAIRLSEVAGVKYGTGSITIPNGSNAGSGTAIAHGLGVVPSAVLITSNSGQGGSYSGTGLRAIALTSTTFTPQGTNFNGYASGIVVAFSWLAIA